MTAYDNSQLRAAITSKLAGSDSETHKSDGAIAERPRLSEADKVEFEFMILQARARNLIERKVAKREDFKSLSGTFFV